MNFCSRFQSHSQSELVNFWLQEIGQSPVKKDKKSISNKLDLTPLNCDHVVPGAYLTPQETRCVKGLLAGGTIKEVAMDLGLSYRTVEFYVNNIKKKFGVKKKKLLLSLLRQVKELV